MSYFLVIRVYLTSTLEIKKYKYEENRDGEIGGAATGMSVNPTRLTDGEVSTTLVEMAQAITLQA